MALFIVYTYVFAFFFIQIICLYFLDVSIFINGYDIQLGNKDLNVTNCTESEL